MIKAFLVLFFWRFILLYESIFMRYIKCLQINIILDLSCWVHYIAECWQNVLPMWFYEKCLNIWAHDFQDWCATALLPRPYIFYICSRACLVFPNSSSPLLCGRDYNSSSQILLMTKSEDLITWWLVKAIQDCSLEPGILSVWVQCSTDWSTLHINSKIVFT